MTDWSIEGGTMLRGDTLCTEALHLADGLVAEQAPMRGRGFDAPRLMVLPGIIDLMATRRSGNYSHAPASACRSRWRRAGSKAQIIATGVTIAFLGVSLRGSGGCAHRRPADSQPRRRDAGRSARPSGPWARICEFPMAEAVAASARAADEAVAMGVPNVVRGGSQSVGPMRRRWLSVGW